MSAGLNSGSQYIGPHMGEPCTLHALDHRLVCGHKVITMTPELCASNCCIPESSFANPRSIDSDFICLACISDELRVERRIQINSFVAELEVVARNMRKRNPRVWIGEKLKIMEIAWRDLEVEKMSEEANAGRLCQAIYIVEDYQSMVHEVLNRLSVSSIFPDDGQLAVSWKAVEDRLDIQPAGEPSNVGLEPARSRDSISSSSSVSKRGSLFSTHRRNWTIPKLFNDK